MTAQEEYEYMGKTIDYAITHLQNLRKRYNERDRVLVEFGLRLMKSEIHFINAQFECIRDQFE